MLKTLAEATFRPQETSVKKRKLAEAVIISFVEIHESIGEGKTPSVFRLRDDTARGVPVKIWPNQMQTLEILGGDLLRLDSVERNEFNGSVSLSLKREGTVQVLSRMRGELDTHVRLPLHEKDRMDKLLAWSLKDPLLRSLRSNSHFTKSSFTTPEQFRNISDNGLQRAAPKAPKKGLQIQTEGAKVVTGTFTLFPQPNVVKLMDIASFKHG